MENKLLRIQNFWRKKTKILGILACIAATSTAGAKVAMKQFAVRQGVNTNQQGTLTFPEMLKKADESIKYQEQVTKNLQTRFEQARAKRDVIQALCLQDKIDQQKGVFDTSKGRRSTLRMATERGDLAMAKHESTILEYLKDRTNKVATAAAQCIDQSAYQIGSFDVHLSIGLNMPPTDVTLYPKADDDDAPPYFYMPPQCVSCTGVLN